MEEYNFSTFRCRINKNENIEKELIRELQRIGIERNITNFCTFEMHNNKERIKVLLSLEFKDFTV